MTNPTDLTRDELTAQADRTLRVLGGLTGALAVCFGGQPPHPAYTTSGIASRLPGAPDVQQAIAQRLSGFGWMTTTRTPSLYRLTQKGRLAMQASGYTLAERHKSS